MKDAEAYMGLALDDPGEDIRVYEAKQQLAKDYSAAEVGAGVGP